MKSEFSELFTIAPSITTPIALAALALLVLYALYKVVLSILGPPDQQAVPSILKYVVNWVAVIALVALLLSLTPQIVALFLPRPAEAASWQTAINANMARRDYASAEEAADKLLERAPNDVVALNAKGSVAFYRQDFEGARKFFARAHALRPNDNIVLRNLADAEVEVGALEDAERLYLLLKDGRPETDYALGRVCLLDGRYACAVAKLRSVPTTYAMGTARVLEAAALAQLSERELSARERAALRTKARQVLNNTIRNEPAYWHGILTKQRREERERYDEVIPLLKGVYSGSRPS